MSNEKTLREAPVGKLLPTMSLPVIVVMLVTVLYNMADVFFMGRTGDAVQVAAISLAGPVFSVISAISTLIGFGSCTAIAIALGKKDLTRIKKYSSFAFYFSMVIGIAVMGCILSGMGPLLSMLGTDGQTAEYTAAYLRILALGAPFMMVSGALANTIRADGDSKSAMIATMMGTVANILLDPLLISVLGWGIRGASAATVIGNIISCIVLFVIIRKKKIYSLSIKDFGLRREVSLCVLGLGLPMAAGTLLMSFATAMSNRLLVQYGNIAVAANGVSGKAGMLISMILMGVCMGIQPAISYAYGAGERKRTRQILIGTGIASVAIAVLLSAVFFLFRDNFISVFLNDTEVIDFGRRMMLGSIISMPVCAVYQLCTVYLEGTGKISYATLTSLLRQGIVYLPVLYGMNTLLGLNGLILSAAVADVLSTIVGVSLSIKWSRKILYNLI